MPPERNAARTDRTSRRRATQPEREAVRRAPLWPVAEVGHAREKLVDGITSAMAEHLAHALKASVQDALARTGQEANRSLERALTTSLAEQLTKALRPTVDVGVQRGLASQAGPSPPTVQESALKGAEATRRPSPRSAR